MTNAETTELKVPVGTYNKFKELGKGHLGNAQTKRFIWAQQLEEGLGSERTIRIHVRVRENRKTRIETHYDLGITEQDNVVFFGR